MRRTPHPGLRARLGPLLAMLLAALALGAASARAEAPGGRGAGHAPFAARLLRVLDGDTLLVSGPRGAEKIRLEGIDCPEKGQAFGDRARRFTASWAQGRSLTVRPLERDRYGRWVARVLGGGEDLSLRLLREGLAWHYRQYNQEPALEALERAARARRAGLWSDPAPIPPWSWRRGARAPAAGPAPGAPSAPGPGARAPSAPEPRYRGNVKSRVFHQSGCRQFRCPNCLALFSTRQEAIDQGFRPGGCCQP